MRGYMIVDVIYSNDGGVYFAGQIVDGHIRLRVTDSQQIGEINLQWLGHAIVSWSEGTEDDSTSYSDKETYFDTKTVLLKKKPSQHKYLKLLPGVYRYSFSFQLPLDIPNSYQGFCGWVRYEVTVNVVRPWASNVSKSVPFTVISHLDLNTLPYANTTGIAEDEKILDCLCCMSGLITATITTDRLGYVPGGAITFTAEIHNNSNTNMHPCKAALSMITVKPVGPSSALFVPLMIVIGTIPLKTATHIIPQLEFAESQLVKNDLSPLYPRYTFKSRRGEEVQLAKRRTRIRKRVF